jgi:hypothetical protein
MGKFYEDLDTLNELIKKLDKKNELSIFILRVIKYATKNPTLQPHQILKDIKKSM